MPPSSYRRGRPALFAGFFADFFVAFFVEVFLTAAFFATFFVDVFLAALFATAFFAAFFEAFLAGTFLRTSSTAVTAPPIAVFMTSATFDATAIPTPTVSPAFSTTVFFATFRPPSLCVHTQLRIVDGYGSKCTNLLLSLEMIGFAGGRRRQHLPESRSFECSTNRRAWCVADFTLHWKLPTNMEKAPCLPLRAGSVGLFNQSGQCGPMTIAMLFCRRAPVDFPVVKERTPPFFASGSAQPSTMRKSSYSSGFGLSQPPEGVIP
jgi:hypothetical protein